MGYIVKAPVGDSATVVGPRDEHTSALAAAQVTEILLAARAAADAEWAAAKDAALILARKMAEKIIGRAVDLDARVMADIAEQALGASRCRGADVVLRVHADDLAALEQSMPRWLARKDAPAGIRFVVDETVGRYGCVVETPAGRVDARLATQLDVLERVLGACKRGA
jgi:flagellar biosynthesis/type III secretory pathway protein FliH